MLKFVIVPVIDGYTKITKYATKTFLKIHPVYLCTFICELNIKEKSYSKW